MSQYPHGVSTTEATYLVAGMTCEHCKIAVTDEVSRVPGVTGVEVDLDTKLVRVRGTDVDAEAVVAAVDEAGYDAVAA
jgi:copper chaperone